MIGLIIAGVIIIVLLFIRVGASVEYSDDGLAVVAHAGFIRIKILPRKPKKKLKAKEELREKTDKTAQVKKPGPSLDFKKLFAEALKLFGKIRRRLLVKELTVLYVQAGGNPFRMATTHGAAITAMGLSQAALESYFRVKHYNLHTSVDFLAEKPRIYVYAAFSIAIWEAIYVGFAALMLVLRTRKPKTPEKALEEAKS